MASQTESTNVTETVIVNEVPGLHPHVFVIPLDEPPPPYDVTTSRTLTSNVELGLDHERRLVHRMKNGTASTDDYFMFAYSISRMTVDYLVGFCCILITLGLPVAMMIIGSLYLHSCPAIKSIPSLLIMIGALTSFCNLLNLIDHFLGSKLLDQQLRSVLVVLTNICVNGMVMIMFTFLCIWIYGHPEPDQQNPESPEYCDSAVYLFAYWLSTTVITFIWFLVMISAIFWCISSFGT
ncbi:hypothetical protein HDE_10702 [Halotydeus destructor]|nr:hypothetical protein HDE_10702 [Halotydeus destructor]